MCGLAGYCNLDGRPASTKYLEGMVRVIAHRGPDGEGTLVERNVALGHRRLAILDLSPAGHQPMASPDGRYVIIYNGEIYNYRELRVELEALGHQFHTRTDTEVLLRALIQWQHAALNRLNGMFAFAFLDRAERKLLLARDRYGVKPLYYASVGNALVFGSEVKAILAYPGMAARLDERALVEYLTFQNFFSQRTLFKGVEMLPAGSWLEVDTAAGRIGAPSTYWDFHFVEPEQPRPENDYLEELDNLFRQAVSRQLVSDVEIGAYLSGGMDSGSITALAAPQLPNLKTFTIGFDLRSASGLEMSYDERARAEHLSYKFGTEHYEMVLKAGDMERAMPRLAWHLEEPRVGQSYPNFYAAKLASRFVKVALSGAGGDELFAGYPWRYYRAVVNDDFEHYTQKYYRFWQRLLDEDELRAILQPIWQEVGDISPRDIFVDVFHEHASRLTRPEDYINHSLYFESKTFLHGLLVVEDKLSMAHGLETRVPFLDNDLVDFAIRLPAHLKLGNLGEVVRVNENEPGDKTALYFDKTRDGKLILRRLMERYIPNEVAHREKQGFSAPDASWFKGESIEYVKKKVLSPELPLYDYLDYATVERLVMEHVSGKTNRRLFVWSMLALNEWMTAFT